MPITIWRGQNMKKAIRYAAIALTLASGIAVAQTYQVLYQFGRILTDSPKGTLAMDPSGNIYGTTEYDGVNCDIAAGLGCGTVYELTKESGYYTYNLLYEFCPDEYQCPDGAFPYGGLVVDSAGNLYGTTVSGGAEQIGTVYELSPPQVQGGAWTATVLHSFCTTYHCKDGYAPYSRLLMDSLGNLYGTTSSGGNNTNCPDGCGTVFELSPPTSPAKAWSETVLYDFCTKPNFGHCPDGATPMIGLVSDEEGDLFATTQYGGAQHSKGSGTIFQLTPGSQGYTEKVLYAFPESSSPVGELAIGSDSFLYGALSYSNGIFYRLNLGTGVMQHLEQSGSDGVDPYAGLLVDPAHGIIYGTDYYGIYNGGTIFELTELGEQTQLYEFCSQFDCTDGENPNSTLIEDAAGNLYGTTTAGGYGGCGVVFEFSPAVSAERREGKIQGSLWHDQLGITRK